MFRKFEFENYKSFKEKQSIMIGKDRMLLICGNEMSGKTNMLEALTCCISHIIAPVQYIKKENINIYKRCIPNYDSNNKILFKLEDMIDDNLYNYSIIFEVQENLIIVQKENLYINNEELFQRNKTKVKINSILKKYNLDLNIDESLPYISFLALTQKDDKINDFYENCKKTIFIDSTINSSILNKDIINCLTTQKPLVLKVLKDINRKYKDYIIENNKVINIYNDIQVTFEEDSSTIKSAIIYIPQIINSIKKGKLILIDDIDKKINNKVFKVINTIINDKKVNINNSQLIATTSNEIYIKSSKNVMWI